MEDITLKLNQPLLSVRRFRPSPTLTTQKKDEKRTHKSHPVIPQLPPHRPELKSGPLTNPGTVPFLWERTPGRPKDEIKPEKQTFHRPPVAPKLPPGRVNNRQERDNHNRKSQPSMNNGKVEDIDRHPDNNVLNAKKTTDDKSSDSGDSDGAYVDALDNFSRSESCFLNCSMSELDDLDSKPSGRFSMDPHTRDSMMDRFLPAAKAAASEMPHYASKRHHVAQERPQQVKQTDQFKPSLRYGPSFTMRYSYDLDNNEVDDEDSDGDYDRREYSTGACGLLPRFCIKSSFRLLNPIPAMSMRTRGPISNKVRSRSLSAGSFSDIIDKTRSNKSDTKSIGKGQSGSYSSSTFRDSPPFSEETEEASSIPEEQMNGRIKGLGLLGIKTFQQLIADDQDNILGMRSGSDSGGSCIEKILYVDTSHNAESPNRKEMVDDAADGEAQPVPNVNKCDELLSASFTSDNTWGDGEDINNLSATAKNNPRNKTIGSVEFPCPPPLPKSPADSWLFRTMYAKNSFRAAENSQNRGVQDACRRYDVGKYC